jgi:hypothetical protein
LIASGFGSGGCSERQRALSQEPCVTFHFQRFFSTFNIFSTFNLQDSYNPESTTSSRSCHEECGLMASGFGSARYSSTLGLIFWFTYGPEILGYYF